MNYLCQEFVEHYHEERPHQGLENESPAQSLQVLLEEKNVRAMPKIKKKSRQKINSRKQPRKKSNQIETPAPPTIRLSEIRCQQRLGGLLKSYSRAA